MKDKIKLQNLPILFLKTVVISLWFGFFAIIIRPEIGRIVIPRLIDFTEAQAEANEGVDLDPIIATSGSEFEETKSSLYSTKSGYGQSIYGDLVTSDTRVVAMNRFLADYSSPMAPYAEVFISTADEVGLDWRLVASISGVESAFGRIIPYNSYNAWGWKGGPGGSFSQFSSWEESASYVTRRIAAGYGTDSDPFAMESTYCPPCGMNPRHSWANGVSRYMNELSDYRANL